MDKHWNDVIGIGSAVYDVLMAVDRFPAEDTKLEGRETRVQGGGPCATALVAAQKLGVSTAYMGTVGGRPLWPVPAGGFCAPRRGHPLCEERAGRGELSFRGAPQPGRGHPHLPSGTAARFPRPPGSSWILRRLRTQKCCTWTGTCWKRPFAPRSCAARAAQR